MTTSGLENDIKATVDLQMSGRERSRESGPVHSEDEESESHLSLSQFLLESNDFEHESLRGRPGQSIESTEEEGDGTVPDFFMQVSR
jgi:hypothetical protein